MKKKIAFTALWTITFGMVTFIAGMIGFAVLGFAGMASWKESTVVLIGRSWSFVFFTMPVLGLILSLFGVLPGTRTKKESLAK